MIADLSAYKADHGAPVKRVLADMLDWCAHQYPYAVIGYNELFAKIHRLKAIPRLEDAQVLKWARGVYAVSPILEDRYERILMTFSELHGCRASADMGEFLRYGLRKQSEKYINKTARLIGLASRFHPEAVPTGKGYEEDLAWYNACFKPVLQDIGPRAVGLLRTPPRRALSLPPKRRIVQ